MTLLNEASERCETSTRSNHDDWNVRLGWQAELTLSDEERNTRRRLTFGGMLLSKESCCNSFIDATRWCFILHENRCYVNCCWMKLKIDSILRVVSTCTMWHLPSMTMKWNRIVAGDAEATHKCDRLVADTMECPQGCERYCDKHLGPMFGTWLCLPVSSSPWASTIPCPSRRYSIRLILWGCECEAEQ